MTVVIFHQDRQGRSISKTIADRIEKSDRGYFNLDFSNTAAGRANYVLYHTTSHCKSDAKSCMSFSTTQPASITDRSNGRYLVTHTKHEFLLFHHLFSPL